MGYRSEVAIACTRNLYDKILNDMNAEDREDFIKHTIVSDEDQCLICFDWIKWYSGYSLVDVVEKYINNKPDEIYLMRIGEDYEDFEQQGGFFNEEKFGMYYHRGIQFNEEIQSLL